MIYFSDMFEFLSPCCVFIFNITIIQVYAPTSNTEEAEAEQFYEDLQELLELTHEKDVLCIISSVQFSSVTQSCLTLCDPMNRSMPGLPVHHHLLEFTQTHVHWVRDAIEPSHPGSSLFPPDPNLSQHHSLFQHFAWGVQSTGASALALFLPKISQGWSTSEWTGWISLQSKGLSRVFSNTTVQKHQFFGAQLSSQSNSHIHTWLLEKP